MGVFAKHLFVIGFAFRIITFPPALCPQVSNVTSEVSDCSAVDVSKCNQSFVLMHGVKSVPWQEIFFCFLLDFFVFFGKTRGQRQEQVGFFSL